MLTLGHAVERLSTAGDKETLAIESKALIAELVACVDGLEVRLHPLGFYHVELTPLMPMPGRRVRLHIWDAPVQADDMGLMHDHMWSLTSVIVAGGLTNILFDATADPFGPYDGVRVRYGSRNSFKFESRYLLTESARDELRAMQVYRVPARIVHTTLVTTFPTVTLAVTVDENDKRGPLIFSRESRPEGTPVRAPAESSYVRSILQSLASEE
jgi:hypothetical protein